MRRLAFVVSVVSLTLAAGCEQPKPPLTPDTENTLGDAGVDITDPTPAPSTPPAPAPAGPAPAPK